MRPETKKILKYTLTPQIMPRIRDLFYSGFSYISFFMAQIYRAVRLLPNDHPYLNPYNIGRFGVRHVVAEAGNHLEIKKENIDQIAIYILMILGIVLLATQFFMLFITGFVDVAHAGGLYASSSPLNFFSYFQTPHAKNDLAFVLLDRVFGIPGTRGGVNTSFFADVSGGYSCVAMGQPCFDLGQSSRAMTPDNIIYKNYARTDSTTLDFPWPFHEALRGMFQVYSVGLLVVAIFIFLYLVFAVAAETAQTGTAFGKRYNHFWVPIRLVVAMGLLVPITYGLNSAQWILMYSAKWGSSFATNGWVIYNNSLTNTGTLLGKTDTLLGKTDTLVATPGTPPINTLMEFASVLATCKISYERIYKERIANGKTRPAVKIKAWLINSEDITMVPVLLKNTSFQAAIDYFNGGVINVRFGELRNMQGGNQTWDGRVAPLCGELSLDLTYAEQKSATMAEPGSYSVLERYYKLIDIIWDDVTGGRGISRINAILPTPLTNPPSINFWDIGESISRHHLSTGNDQNVPLPYPKDLAAIRTLYEAYIRFVIDEGVTNQQGSREWTENLSELGWGGAAIWYNKIAQLNGGLVSAVYAMPVTKKYPFVMEEVKRKQAASDSGAGGKTSFRAYRSTDAPIPLDDDEEMQVAKALNAAKDLWKDNHTDTPKSSSVYIDAINMIFGTQGLFNITAPSNQNVHPLAQLSAIGRSLVDSAIRNMGYSAAAGLAGGLANLSADYQAAGSIARTASSFFYQVAMIGLSLGFVMFYILPFLPFIYFFFAVGNWIKGIFEAMLGVPLWALAHIRIDGEGLPGQAAVGGYYLILEVFLRPILIIFGFIAGITILSAQVQILNEIWTLVVSSVAGFNIDDSVGKAKAAAGSIEFLRGAVDNFFFTIIYAILCYMMAMSSFKLIDLIPNSMLRWMGASVSSFGDESGETAKNMVRNSYLSSSRITGTLGQAVSGASAGASSGAQALKGLSGRLSKG